MDISTLGVLGKSLIAVGMVVGAVALFLTPRSIFTRDALSQSWPRLKGVVWAAVMACVSGLTLVLLMPSASPRLVIVFLVIVAVTTLLFFFQVLRAQLDFVARNRARDR